RGESYLLYLGRPELARADLAAAISTFERVIADAECDAADLSLAISHFPRSLLFRGHAQRELGRLDAALADVTRAVERFEEAIAAGRESLEPLFAWALQSRAEILLEAYGDGAGARRDLDLAIAILGKWSRRQEGL